MRPPLIMAWRSMVAIVAVASLRSTSAGALAPTILLLGVEPSSSMLFDQTTRPQVGAIPASRAAETPDHRRPSDRQGRRGPKQTIELAPRLIKGTDDALAFATRLMAGYWRPVMVWNMADWRQSP
jgi:hypothetical protein